MIPKEFYILPGLKAGDSYQGLINPFELAF